MGVRCPKHKSISASNVLFLKQHFTHAEKLSVILTGYFLALCKRQGFPCCLTFKICPSFLLLPGWGEIAQTVYSSFAVILSVCSTLEFCWGHMGRCVSAPGSLLLATGGVFSFLHRYPVPYHRHFHKLWAQKCQKELLTGLNNQQMMQVSN